MRLTDLNPKWVTADDTRRGQGVRFNCPLHPEGGCARPLIVVPFSNPIDGGAPYDPKGWQRTGDTFETLTLHPSVDAHENLPDGGTRSRWHGWVKDGEVT